MLEISCCDSAPTERDKTQVIKTVMEGAPHQWQRRHGNPLGETEAGPVTGRVEEGEVESGWVAVLSHGMSCKHSRT